MTTTLIMTTTTERDEPRSMPAMIWKPPQGKKTLAIPDGVLRLKTESRRDGVEQATTIGCKIPSGDMDQPIYLC